MQGHRGATPLQGTWTLPAIADYDCIMHSSQALSLAEDPRPAATHCSLLATRYSLAVIVALGLVLRLVGLARQGFWTDELYVVWEARQPLDVLFNPQLHIHHPPGYRLAMRAWMELGGLGEWWLRLLPALSGVALIVVAWALSRELWPARPWAAVGAALFVATSPFLVHYGQDVTAYSWVGLWVAVSVLLLLRAWREDRVWLWAAWGVSLAVCLYSHYFTFFPITVEVVAALAVGIRARLAVERSSGRVRGAALAIGGAALLYAPWVWTLLTQGGQALRPVLFPLSVDDQPLSWVPVLFAGYANTGFWQSEVGKWLVWALLVGALVRAGWNLSKSRSAHGALATLVVIAWGIGAIVGPYLFLRVTTPADAVTPVRFAAMSAPALMLGLGALVGGLPRLGRGLLLGSWVAVAGAQLYVEYKSPPRQDWRGVMAIVARDARPGDEMLAFTAFHAGAVAAYYTVPVPVKGGRFVGEGADPSGAAFWFRPDWSWRGFLDTDAYRSIDFQGEIAKRSAGAARLWYLAGDGTDGTYKPSAAAERALTSLGWQPTQEWRASPLVLKLYVKSGR
jgi:4-amino-4-deoxy-L-arabinose transferase-like glycosyltransferase